MPLTAFHNTFAGNPLDRASDRRIDPAWIAEQFDTGAARALPFWNGAPLVRSTEAGVRLAYLDAFLARELAEGQERRVFLGVDGDGAAMFAIEIEGASDPSEGALHGLGRFTDLRELAAELPSAEAGIAATGRAVFEWRRRHRFCGVCGQPTHAMEAGWKRVCEACRTEVFPRTDPVVIMLPVQGERCLLGRQASWPAGRFSALAGFLEPGETIEEACAREVREEAALDVLRVHYHSSQPWPFPANLMIGLIAQVAEGEGQPDQTELEAVRWISRPEARAVLAGDHEIKAPPRFAIAHSLIRAWAEGETA